MTFEQLFQIANGIALAAWIILIVFPRKRVSMLAVRYGFVGLFALAYAVLASQYLFAVDGASFASLAGIARLLSSEPALLIGWLHYLAFDLFVGTWIAERADALGWSRWWQAPILLTTFLLGPIGLLAFYFAAGGGVLAGRRI